MKSPTEQQQQQFSSSSTEQQQANIQSSLENRTSSPTPSSPDYATIDFGRDQSVSSTPVANSSASPTSKREVKQETAEIISPPKRGIKKKRRQPRMNGNGNEVQSFSIKHLPHSLDSNNNSSRAAIYQNLPLYTRSSVTNHSASVSENNYDALEERDRQFATAICIFSSVLTMVLVLMFYLVGEAAFRSILLILAFVFFLTLLLACFLRRPTAIVFTSASRNFPSTNPKLPTTYHLQSSHFSQHHHQNQQSNSRSVFMISPPPAVLPPQNIHPLCPVHSRPESRRSFPPPISEIENNKSFSPPPPLPPKSPPPHSPPPPVPPSIQTIPNRSSAEASSTSNNLDKNSKRYSSSSSSSSTFSQDSLEIIDKIEGEKLQYKY